MEASQSITRKSASNLALAFVLLPKAKREGMSALYAFCREVDDLADEETRPLEERRTQLAAWREDIARACNGATPRFRVNQELQLFVARHRLPFSLFDELIRGVEMDLDIQRYATFPELEVYCYRVASVVGLLSIEIFGYQDAACRDYANYLGKALQLTNILRDVKVDAERQRIYLPLDELKRFQVTEAEILNHQYSERYGQLAQSMADKACEFYQGAKKVLPVVDRRSMASAELMGAVYWRLLTQLRRQRFDVFGPKPTRLSKAQKLALICRTWFRVMVAGTTPNYGTP